MTRPAPWARHTAMTWPETATRVGPMGRAMALVLVAACLSGCGESGFVGALRSAGAGASPDEFMVLPTRPLEMPADLAALPPPTPGATNRVDPRPEIEAVAALTGRAVPAGQGSAPTLVARAGPVEPGIRARLAAEDAEYRRANRGLLLERIANRGNDWTIYRDQMLDADAEFVRLRARGLRVPAAPPIAP